MRIMYEYALSAGEGTLIGHGLVDEPTLGEIIANTVCHDGYTLIFERAVK